MKNSDPKKRTVKLLLTEEHLRKMIENNLLDRGDLEDAAKVAHTVQKVLDKGLGLPETSWHDWDGWGEGLE
jgi:NifB/MoaA-like Fe-S oxidoreductase